MEYFTEAIQEKMKTNYKANSHLQFIKSTKFFYKAIDKKLTKFSFDDINNNEQKIIEYLKDKSVSTQSTYLSYLYLLYKLDDKSDTFPKLLSKTYDEIKPKLKQHVKENPKKASSDLKIKTVYEYYKSQIDFKNEEQYYNNTLAMRFMLSSILNEVPLRLNEAMSLKWKDDKKTNYISIENKCMLIRVHKSMRSKKIGHKYFDLSENIIEDLKWFKKNQTKNITECTYLFTFRDNNTQVYHPDKTLSQDSSGQFYDNLIRNYGKKNGTDLKLGIHDLRNQYFSEGCKNLNIDEKALNELMRMSQILGHSDLRTTVSYYFREKKGEPVDVDEEEN